MRWRIRRQLIVLTLIPNVILVLLLGGYLAHIRFFDNQSHLQAESQFIVSRLQNLLSSDDLSSSQASTNVVNAALSYDDVNAAGWYDANGTMVSSQGALPAFSTLMHRFLRAQKDSERQLVNVNHVYYYVQPIHHASFASSKPIGYLVVGLDSNINGLMKSKEMIAMLLIALIAFLTGLYYSLKLSNEITEPLVEVTHAIEKVKAGQLDVRIRQPAKGELKQLKLSMNTLIDAFRLLSDQRERAS